MCCIWIVNANFINKLILSIYLFFTMKASILFAAEYFTDRTDVQCLHRWQKVLNPDLVKGPWTKEVALKFRFASILLFGALFFPIMLITTHFQLLCLPGGR